MARSIWTNGALQPVTQHFDWFGHRIGSQRHRGHPRSHEPMNGFGSQPLWTLLKTWRWWCTDGSFQLVKTTWFMVDSWWIPGESWLGMDSLWGIMVVDNDYAEIVLGWVMGPKNQHKNHSLVVNQLTLIFHPSPTVTFTVNPKQKTDHFHHQESEDAMVNAMVPTPWFPLKFGWMDRGLMDSYPLFPLKLGAHHYG